MIVLSLIIPCGPEDKAALSRLQVSIDTQDFPREQREVLVIYEGNSEEAKALGIQKASGEILGMLCTDNLLSDPTFLSTMVTAASRPDVVGAYPRQYAYEATDPSLTRYFALLGANDPVCAWLGKADRASYCEMCPSQRGVGRADFPTAIPSLGDNGFFLKRQAAQLVVKDAATFGSCMDMCENLRRLGLYTYAITPNTISHRTGDSWQVYFSKRYRYVRELYWKKLSLRRWRMVDGYRDWIKVGAFALCSLLLLPHLWLVLRGYRRLRDPAWFWHPVICSGLTLVYTWALCQQLPSLFRHWIGHRSLRHV